MHKNAVKQYTHWIILTQGMDKIAFHPESSEADRPKDSDPTTPLEKKQRKQGWNRFLRQFTKRGADSGSDGSMPAHQTPYGPLHSPQFTSEEKGKC